MLLPACYENVFAFRPDQTCAAPIVPTSGLYIDDLEGISLKTVGSNGKHTYQNAQAVLNAKTAFALQKTEIWLQSVLQRRGFILPQLQPAANLCSYKSTTQTVAAGARGVTLYRRHGATNLANIYIDKAQYKAKTSGTATLLVQNTDGVTLYASSATPVTADMPITFVLSAYFSVDVRVLVITDTEPYDTDCDSNCGCLHSQNTAKHRRAAMYKVVGFDGTNDAASGFGVTVCAAVRCSIQSLMCYILDMIKLPLRLYVGIELLREFRANNAVTAQNPAFYTKDLQKETMATWQREAESQLAIQIDTILASLRDYDPYCISCHAPNRITIASLR